MTVFDAIAFKTSTRVQWDSVAERWNAWGAVLDRWLGPATERLLDLCEPGPGDSVLHVAGGAGHDAKLSAARVGASGHVLSTDISGVLTDIANREFQAAGLSQARAVAMDGEALDVEPERYDLVISRLGLIFFPDQQESLRQQVAALKAGGRIGVLAYAPAETNGFFAGPIGIIRRHAGLPPPAPGQPGPFSLSAPGKVQALFKGAGLVDIVSETIPAPLILDSGAEALRFEQETFGALHQMLDGLDREAKRAAWDEVATALNAFETARGFEGPCELIAAVGRKPD